MRLATQPWREYFDRLERRFRTFRRALAGNGEDRFRLIRFVVLRLPIPPESKQRVVGWALKHFTGHRSFSASTLASAQRRMAERGRARLTQLLSKEERIYIPAWATPRVSFILVLLNKAELSVLAIDSVVQFASVPYELVVVDNGSDDSTCSLLERIDGANILRNEKNEGFGPACMQAAAVARGEFLCFVNNDALLTKGAITATLRNFEQPGIGAVGGKVLLADGSLQEAGSIIWSDGSAYGYGRRDDPELPQYSFRRLVDYCSGVFLVTPKQLFDRLGGFSREFAPAYYEDVDYCMSLWKQGYSVVYEPLARVLHYESAASGGVEAAAVLMRAHQTTFQSKWSVELSRHFCSDPGNIIPARIAVNAPGLRIIYIDDRLPQRFLGAGFPRSNDVLRQLVALGHHVVCATFTFPLLEDTYGDMPLEVEQFDGYRSREDLIERYFPWADVVWISRPHNLKLLLTSHASVLDSRKFRLVYDAEAIFSQRMQAQSALLGEANPEPEFLEPRDLEEEIALAKTADAVVVVSERDRQTMVANGIRRASVVGFQLSLCPTRRSFGERHTFLFVGSVHGSENPNADSLRYFCSNIWKEIHRATGSVLEVAGFGTDTMRNIIVDDTVRILGQVSDLQPLYDRARVFVVPTRYAAGLPFKAYEAAAYGVPLVVSEMIANQLQWSDGHEYLVGSAAQHFADCCSLLYRDEELWTHVRDNALARVSRELSAETFRNSVDSVLKEVGTPGVRTDAARRLLKKS